MTDAGLNIFNTIKTHRDLEYLISGGEAESLHLECKAPGEPHLTKQQKNQLAIALSGFSNTGGGVVLYGMSTTTHSHSGLDVITQIEPIGQINRFEQIIKLAIPTLTMPSIQHCQIRIIKEKTTDTKGVLAVYVPMTAHDPVQSTHDNTFYYRTGDEFKPAPYNLIRRLFAAVESPDLKVDFPSNLVTIDKSGAWNIPIILANQSSAIAEHVKVFVQIMNSSACTSINADGFNDISRINPGTRMYSVDLTSVVHRGLNFVAGTLIVQMAKGKRPKRRLDIDVNVYANKMRARKVKFQLHLVKAGVKVKNVRYEDVY